MPGLAAVNLAYFYALAAVAVPVIIHFLFKARKQQIEFSSIEFILASTVLKSSRIRFKELLLLLLRVAIVALITLAFARPFLKSDVSVFGLMGRTDLVLVVDDSYSMGYREGRRTRFANAVGRAQEAVGRLRRGDRVGLVLASRPQLPELKLTPNFATARTRLKQIRCTFRTSVLASALERAVATLQKSTADHKVVYVLSDFQQATWGFVGNVLARLPADVKIKTAHMGKTDAPNLAVLGLRGVRDTFTSGGKVELLARVANYSHASADGVKLTLSTAGQPRAEKALTLEPLEVREVGFRITAPEGPALPCQLRLSPTDSLPADDVFQCVLSQGRPLRVLCVEEKIADVPYFQETFYLRTALDPTAENIKSISAVRTDLVERVDLEKSNAFGYDVLVLAGVTGLSDSQAQHVEAFVRAGGGLIVFLGPGAEPAIYNKLLFKRGAGVLPARLREIVKTLGKGQEYFRLDQIDMEHPVFEVFQQPFSGDLTQPRFTGAFRVDTAPCPAARVLARFDNGLCAVVEREFGLGRCVLMTWTASSDWTNLPKRMVYVPLVHQLVNHASRRKTAKQTPFVVGDRVSIPRSLLAEATGVVVKDAKGKEHALDVAREGLTVFSRTDQPGAYWVEAVVGATQRRLPVWQFGVGLATVESDLSPAPVLRVAELSERSATKAAAVEEAAEIESREGELPPSLWRYLFVAALCCMVVELCIANWRQ